MGHFRAAFVLTRRLSPSLSPSQAEVVPWKLWAAVAGLVSLDLVLLITWAAVDPLKRDVRNFPVSSCLCI